MAQSVEIPGRGVAEFPDEMSPDEIKGVIKKKFFQQPTPAPTPDPVPPEPSPTATQKVIEGIKGVAEIVQRGQQMALNPAPLLTEKLVPESVTKFMRTGLVSPETMGPVTKAAMLPIRGLTTLLFGKEAVKEPLETTGKALSELASEQTTPEMLLVAAGTMGVGRPRLSPKEPSLRGVLFPEESKVPVLAPETTSVGEAAAPERPPVQPEPVAVQRPPLKPEVVEQGSASPTAPPSDRWTADRGSMPGEPELFLDGDAATARAAIIEAEVPGKGVLYDLNDNTGKKLGTFSTADEAAKYAESVYPKGADPAPSTKPAPEPAAARAEPGGGVVQKAVELLNERDRAIERSDRHSVTIINQALRNLPDDAINGAMDKRLGRAQGEPVVPEPAAEAPVKERGAFADVFAKRAMQTPDEYLESLSQPERRGGTDADHLYQHKVAVRQALKEGDPVLASNVERYNLQPEAPKVTSIKNAEVAAERAGLEAAGRVEDFIPSDQALRSTAFGRGLAAEDTLSVPKTELRSSDARVESRWKDATRTERSLFQKAKDAAISIKNEFTRADPYLDPKTDAPLIDTIRRFRTIPRHSQELAANIIRGFTAGLGKNKFEVYQRNIILNDLARDVEAGRYAGRELPFGYTPETLKADTVKFQELAKANPLVEQSLATRNKFMDTLKNELVENDLLPEQVLQEGDYFHRQVVDYLNAKDAFTTGIGTKDVRVGKKGFQRERTFSSKDYNTKYLEAEYEVISQALSQLRTKKTFAELKGSDIKPQLMEEAKAQGANWEELIPGDHAIWQPKEGNVFYPTMTIPEKVIDGIFNGDRQLSKSDLREVLAMGGAREQWVIPKRLAKTLDNISPKTKDSFIDRMAQDITNGWKVWTLLNPVRSVKYGLNNLSGDLDISMAYSPKIAAQYGPKAAKDMYRYVLKRGAMTPEVSEGIEKGVLSSGFSVSEVPDISSHQFFRAVTGDNPSLIDRTWQKNKDYHNWRENVLRLASWRFFKDKLAGAKEGQRFYGASRKSEIDGLYDSGAPKEDIAAKLARELIGDYGNISHAGQWIRTHAIPFYSWMEINAPRYVRLLKNAAAEGEGNVAGRAVGVIAKRTALKAIGKTAKTGAYAAGMYGLVNLWNHTRFPKEEAELGESRRDLHLILGRNEDGSIKTLRVQGALSDALSWFGGEDLPSDVQDVATGKATIGEKAIEAVKAPPTKVVSGITPFVKTPLEALTKQSLFPDPFDPRPIRDSTEAIARMFSLDKPYQYFADKPMRPVLTEIANLVTYTTEPGEAAYHMTRGLVSKWQTKQGGEKSSIIPTKRQNALFYYKKATQLGETEKAERWKQRYMDMGGKEEGLAKSVAVSSPLGGLSQKRKTDFLNSLNPKEREIVDRADDWYTEIYGNTSTRKFKGF